jgi:hypothetical protein
MAHYQSSESIVPCSVYLESGAAWDEPNRVEWPCGTYNVQYSSSLTVQHRVQQLSLLRPSRITNPSEHVREHNTTQHNMNRLAAAVEPPVPGIASRCSQWVVLSFLSFLSSDWSLAWTPEAAGLVTRSCVATRALSGISRGMRFIPPVLACLFWFGLWPMPFRNGRWALGVAVRPPRPPRPPTRRASADLESTV